MANKSVIQFARFCQLAAANVHNKLDNIRFSQQQLERALDPNDGRLETAMVDLTHQIMEVCECDPVQEDMWLHTLLEIHKLWRITTNQWVARPGGRPEPEKDKDEFGFEIF